MRALLLLVACNSAPLATGTISDALGCHALASGAFDGAMGANQWPHAGAFVGGPEGIVLN